MQHLYEKVSYLRGLCDGMELSKESKEGKVLAAVIETLDEFADAIVELYEEQQELSEYVDSIDEIYLKSKTSYTKMKAWNLFNYSALHAVKR